MGLDSVELVMAFEHFFEIEVPNDRAAEVRTVGDMVDEICRLRNVKLPNDGWQNDFAERICVALRDVSGDPSVKPEDRVFEKIPQEEIDKWKNVHSLLNLRLPFMYPNNGSRQWYEFWKHKNVEGWNECSVMEFAGCVVAENYGVLLDPQQIATRQQVFLVVKGITSERMGLHPYEIQPDKSFTKDLGVD